jgi:hypothetical protein
LLRPVSALTGTEKGDMLENEVESFLVGEVELRGGMAPKFVSPSHRGFPDRLVLMPVPPRHQAIVARYVNFVELKRPGKGARVQQQQRIADLTALGFKACVVDSKQGALLLMRWIDEQ